MSRDLRRGAAGTLPNPPRYDLMVFPTSAMSSSTEVFPAVSLKIPRSHRNTCVGLCFIGLTFLGAAAPVPAASASQAIVSQTDPTRSAAPDITTAVQAFSQVRGWLDAEKVPSSAEATDPPSVQGAGVVLRLRGRVVGMGRAIAGQTAQTKSSVLASAAEQAVASAKQDAAVKAIGPGGLARLTLELEVAGEPQPLIGGTFEQVLAPLHPAAQGLALRSGESWAYLPASIVLARGMAAPLSRSLLALMTELRLPPRDLPDLRAAGSTAVYSVPAVRLCQAQADSSPRALLRLNPVLASEPLTTTQANELAEQIADRLSRQLVAVTNPDSTPENPSNAGAAAFAKLKLGLPGAYDPLADESREVTAPPADQALCAYALARAARDTEWPADERAKARRSAVRILQDLAVVEEGEFDPIRSANAAAVALLALEALRTENAAAPADKPDVPTQFEERLRNQVTAALTRSDPHSAAARPLSIAAAAARQRSGRALVPLAELEGALGDAWSRVDQNSLMTSAPWLLTAERELRLADPSSIPASELRIAPHRKLLETALAAMIGTQVVAQTDSSSPPDIWGAYPMLEGKVQRTTAQSTRAMHMVALLREFVSTTNSSRSAADQSLMSSARFLAQLQAGPAMEYAMRTPDRANGGIMTAPYDPQILPVAQGMALLALVEALNPAKVPGF